MESGPGNDTLEGSWTG